MDEAKKEESHLTSAAAFVEGGIQEAFDDGCSICLEGFSDSDPAAVTSCKHEFHLQCVLEWCQRSSNCPMCWQNITMKDPTSQELLEAVEREKSFRLTPSRNAIFHHPTFGSFELQHLPVGMDSAELECRILQHLAAAAAMGRTRHISRREGSMRRPSSQDREFVVFPAQVNGSSIASGGQETCAVAAAGNNTSAPSVSINNEGTEHTSITSSSSQRRQMSISASRTSVSPVTRSISNDNRNNASQSSLPNQDRAGPSEFQSFSNTWKSRFSSLSMKYKESIAKSTKELKEKLFSRSSSMADISSEDKREVNSGIVTLTRMMERLETRDNNQSGNAPEANNAVNPPVDVQSNNNSRMPDETLRNENKATFASSSVSR